MAMIKHTFLFEQTNGEQQQGIRSGWSETFYRDTTLEADPNGGNSYAKRRSGFLTRSAACIGCRLQEIGGGSRIVKFVEVGSIGTDSDIPQMALNCSMKSITNPYKRTIQLRGIPDNRVAYGQYVPSQQFASNFTSWALSLGSSSFRFQAIDRANPRVKIFSIDMDGNFVIAAGATFAVGDAMIIRTCRNTAGVSVNGTYFVETRIGNESGKLRGWTGGVVTVKGTMAKLAYTYPIINGQSVEIQNVTTRKVGRPFFSFLGRQRKRR